MGVYSIIMRVLGVDPGLSITGYGVVEKEKNSFYSIDFGYISTPSQLAPSQRLLIIYKGLKKLIAQFCPEAMAMERLFFCKNTRTALQVGEARGALYIAATEKELPVFEYTPLQVKQAVTGYGRADKKQVQQMVYLLLNLKKIPSPDDAADALAVALCHLQSYRWNMLTRRQN